MAGLGRRVVMGDYGELPEQAADEPRPITRPHLVARSDEVSCRLARLARTIEVEIVPRLVLARRADPVLEPPTVAWMPTAQDVGELAALVLAADRRHGLLACRGDAGARCFHRDPLSRPPGPDRPPSGRSVGSRLVRLHRGHHRALPPAAGAARAEPRLPQRDGAAACSAAASCSSPCPGSSTRSGSSWWPSSSAGPAGTCAAPRSTPARTWSAPCATSRSPWSASRPAAAPASISWRPASGRPPGVAQPRRRRHGRRAAVHRPSRARGPCRRRRHRTRRAAGTAAGAEPVEPADPSGLTPPYDNPSGSPDVSSA